MRSVLRLSPLVLLLLPLGCGGGSAGPKLAPVSGQVTLDDKPLVGARVTFRLLDNADKPTATESFGITDSDGKYKLATDKRDGAPVGKHRVEISIFNREAKKDEQHPVPKKYNLESKLTHTVPDGGDDKANFSLKKSE